MIGSSTTPVWSAAGNTVDVQRDRRASHRSEVELRDPAGSAYRVVAAVRGHVVAQHVARAGRARRRPSVSTTTAATGPASHACQPDTTVDASTDAPSAGYST